MRKLCSAIFAFIILLSLTQNPVLGQTYETPGFEIDGENYTKEQLIWDFTNIAINRHLWLDDTEIPQDSVYWFKRYTWVPEDNNPDYTQWLYPILTEYIFRTKGLPKAFAINKWSEEITIGIDWQRRSYEENDKRVRYIHGMSRSIHDPEIYALFKKYIDEIVPLLETITGLPVTLYDVNDPREKTTDHARIRIVPRQHMNNRLARQRCEHPTESCPLAWSYPFEARLSTGIAFTQFENGRAEGYFLPDANNNIAFSACLIDPEENHSIIKSHITECLLRALGLPSLSKIKSDALLGDWREKTSREEETKSWLENIFPVQEKKEHDNAAKPPVEITEYDAVIGALLYCPAVKPGMDIYQVIDTLKQEENNCLSRAQNIINK